MAKVKGWIVPDDWDGHSYKNWMFCAPCSQQWDGIVRGAIYNLSRARNWDAATGDFLSAAALGKEVYFSMGNCNDGFLAIAAAIEQLAAAQSSSGGSCHCPEGTGTELDGDSENEPTVFGPGTPWPTEEAYRDDKCHVANVMWEQYREVLQQLSSFNVDSLLTLGVSLGVAGIAAILTGLVATGPIVVVSGIATGIFTLMAGTPGFSFSDILTSFDSNKQDIVCALYNATTGTQAHDDFVAAIDDGTLTVFEQSILGLMTTMGFINQIFETPADVLAVTPTSPINCDDCATGPLFWATNFQFGAYTANPAGAPMGSGDLTIGGTNVTLSSVPGFDPGLNPVHVLAFTMSDTLEVWDDNGQVVDERLNWILNSWTAPGGGTSGQQRADVSTCVSGTQSLPGLGTGDTHTRGIWIFKASPFTINVDLTSTLPCP